jgi:hypothetical protein
VSKEIKVSNVEQTGKQGRQAANKKRKKMPPVQDSVNPDGQGKEKEAQGGRQNSQKFNNSKRKFWWQWDGLDGQSYSPRKRGKGGGGKRRNALAFSRLDGIIGRLDLVLVLD